MSTALVPIHKTSCAEDEVLRHPGLSRREIEVIQLTADGEDCKGTAQLLGMAVGTVKQYRHKIRIKLGADTAEQMVAMALRRGLIS